jgi:hypothetical protein
LVLGELEDRPKMDLRRDGQGKKEETTEVKTWE